MYRTHENDVFSDSEQLLQKYSILADTLGELSSPAYSQVDLAFRVARVQYELFFSRKPQERILAALRHLISDEYPAETLHRQLLDFLATP